MEFKSSVNPFLYDKPTPSLNDLYHGINKLLLESTHRCDSRTILHLYYWITDSENPESALEFLKQNIDDEFFHPFADPWIVGSMEKIFEKTYSTKVIRLSTRVAGSLTLSHSKGLQHSKRFTIGKKGISFGNYSFMSVSDLMRHLDEKECCICLETVSDAVNIILECGHIFHQNCLDKDNSVRMKCPFCRIVKKKQMVLFGGNCGAYSSYNPEEYE